MVGFLSVGMDAPTRWDLHERQPSPRSRTIPRHIDRGDPQADPSYPQAHVWLAMTLLQQKQYPQAIDEFQKGLQFSGGNPIYLALLGSGYGHAGRRAEAQAVLQKLQTISRQRHVTPESFSLLYVGLGDYNQVFAYADKAYQEHSGMINRIKVDPILDPVRSDPRFAQLLTKVGFQ